MLELLIIMSHNLCVIGNGGLNVGQMTHGASGQSARVAQKALQSFWKNAPRGPDFHFYSKIIGSFCYFQIEF